jgi:hypothetical protein
MNIKVFGLSFGILIISIGAVLVTACTNNQYPAGYGYSPYYGGYRPVNVYSPRYVGYVGGPYYGGYRGAYGYGYRGGRW